MVKRNRKERQNEEKKEKGRSVKEKQKEEKKEKAGGSKEKQDEEKKEKSEKVGSVKASKGESSNKMEEEKTTEKNEVENEERFVIKGKEGAELEVVTNTGLDEDIAFEMGERSS